MATTCFDEENEASDFNEREAYVMKAKHSSKGTCHKAQVLFNELSVKNPDEGVK